MPDPHGADPGAKTPARDGGSKGEPAPGGGGVRSEMSEEQARSLLAEIVAVEAALYARARQALLVPGLPEPIRAALMRYVALHEAILSK